MDEQRAPFYQPIPVQAIPAAQRFWRDTPLISHGEHGIALTDFVAGYRLRIMDSCVIAAMARSDWNNQLCVGRDVAALEVVNLGNRFSSSVVLARDLHQRVAGSNTVITPRSAHIRRYGRDGGQEFVFAACGQ